MFFDIQKYSERELLMYEVYYLYKVVNLQSKQWQVESTRIIIKYINLATCFINKTISRVNIIIKLQCCVLLSLYKKTGGD